ncbi:MAG: homoserine kinase [Myxococcales bacterium]|nr:homoserine kinase [Myxococcales bacterium]
MVQFTELESGQLASLCRQFSLGELTGFRPVAAGTINSNYQIDTAAGRFFLRVNEGKRESEVSYEVAVLRHLVAGGVCTLLPLETGDGLGYARFEGQFISVFPWRDGYQCSSENISERECREIGGALAQLHLAGNGMEPARAGRYTFEAVKAAYEKFSSSSDPMLVTAIATSATEFEWLGERAEQRAQLPTGLIHADLFPDNVLMREGGVLALLDFEQACVGAYCYDLAVCLNAWCFAKVWEPGRARALLSGYQKVRPLGRDEIKGLSLEVRASALRFLVSRIRDIYLPAQGQAGSASRTQAPGKDFRRFLMRLKTWKALGPAGVADLAESRDKE